MTHKCHLSFSLSLFLPFYFSIFTVSIIAASVSRLYRLTFSVQETVVFFLTVHLSGYLQHIFLSYQQHCNRTLAVLALRKFKGKKIILSFKWHDSTDNRQRDRQCALLSVTLVFELKKCSLVTALFLNFGTFFFAAADVADLSIIQQSRVS